MIFGGRGVFLYDKRRIEDHYLEDQAMDGNNNRILVFLGLILAVACFGVGRMTASTPDNITINHRIIPPMIYGEDASSRSYDPRMEPGFVIKIVQRADAP